MSAPYGQDPMDVNYEGTSTDDPSVYSTGSEPAAVPSIPNASLQATGQPMVPSVDTIQLSTYPYVSPWPASDSGSGGVAVSDTVQTAQEYHRQRWEMFTASRALFDIRLRLTDQFKKAASLPQTSRPAYTQTLTGLLNQYHQQYELYVSATASVLPIAQRMLESEPDQSVESLASQYYNPGDSSSSKVYSQLSGELLALMGTPASDKKPLLTLAKASSDTINGHYQQGSSFARQLGMEWPAATPAQTLSALELQ